MSPSEQPNPLLAGRWELTRTEGVDGFLSTMGLSWVPRKAASVALSRGRATIIAKISGGDQGKTVTLRLRQGEGKEWFEFELVTGEFEHLKCEEFEVMNFDTKHGEFRRPSRAGEPRKCTNAANLSLKLPLFAAYITPNAPVLGGNVAN